MSDDGVTAGVIDDAIDVTLEWRAPNVVRREEFLSLSGIVYLLHEEIRDGMMRQARDSR